jgi:16S rRNA U516 pseudouridylate synthase RsuA-like enzyme
MSAVGHRVKRLVRVAIGDYELGNLPPGKTRTLTDKDIGRLRRTRSDD